MLRGCFLAGVSNEDTLLLYTFESYDGYFGICTETTVKANVTYAVGDV